MEGLEIGTIVATRTLRVLGGGEVNVLIGRPEIYKEGLGHYCPYQIVGIGDEKIRRARGVDSVQALMLTLQKVGIDLYTSKEAKSGVLRWEGDENGDLGFPTDLNPSMG